MYVLRPALFSRGDSFSEGSDLVDPLLLPRERLVQAVINAISSQCAMNGVIRITAPPASGKTSLIALVQRSLQKLNVFSLVINCLDFDSNQSESWLFEKFRNRGVPYEHMERIRRVVFLDDALPLFKRQGFIDGLVKGSRNIQWVVVTSYNAELVPDAASPFSETKVFSVNDHDDAACAYLLSELVSVADFLQRLSPVGRRGKHFFAEIFGGP